MLPESDSELREALQTARQERDKARRYLDIVADLVLSLDRDGRITLINRAGCQILGYDDSELIGKHWFTTCQPTRVHRQARARFRQVIAGEKPIIAYYQNHIVTRTGQERLIAWHNMLLTDGDDKIVGILSSGEDITARKQAEEQARKHQTELAHVTRVSTLGEMAAGLAHELNQPLTAVVNSAQSALNRLRSKTGVHQDVLEAIELALAQALRAAEMIRRSARFVQKR
jgi:PAS domain S-box-containing protein